MIDAVAFYLSVGKGERYAWPKLHGMNHILLDREEHVFFDRFPIGYNATNHSIKTTIVTRLMKRKAGGCSTLAKATHKRRAQVVGVRTHFNNDCCYDKTLCSSNNHAL